MHSISCEHQHRQSDGSRHPFSPPPGRRNLFCKFRLSGALLALTFLCSLQLKASVSATTTTLAVTPGNAISQGALLTLRASVLDADETPVLRGSVTFYDGTAILAPVSVVRSGTNSGSATYKLFPGQGTHSFKAVFAAAAGYQSSTSGIQVVIVTNVSTSATATTFSSSGNAGNYTLTGKVTAFGQNAPTGNVTFTDLTNSSYLLGTAALNVATLTNGLQPSVSYPTKTASYGIVMGDLNGDGIPDLVTSNYVTTGSGTISVLIGNGDGTFRTNVDYPALSYAFGMALGDLNGDGAPDLVVANHSASTVSVYLNNGDGTFAAKTDYSVPSGTSEYAVLGDFNGDGYLDIATNNYGGVAILLGHGDGTFAAATYYGTGSAYGYGLASGDFNEDGILDLVASNSGTGVASVFLGNGDGTFQTQTTYATGSSSTSAAVADLNGDGHQDLVIGNAGSSLSVLLGNGDGTFHAKVDYTAAAWGVVIADVNLDGTPDIIASSYAGGVSVLKGNGDGTFQSPVVYASGATDYWVAVGDLNGDGVVDVACANLGAATAKVMLGAISETATVSGITIPGGGRHSVSANYQGDSHSAISSSVGSYLSGSLFSTSLSLSFSPSSINPGQPMTLTATLTPLTAIGYTAGGTVTFADNGTPLGTAVALTAGQAVYTSSAFASGTHAITATYSGDLNFLSSVAEPESFIVHPVSLVSLVSSSPNAYMNTSVTFTATVAASAIARPTGTISFYDGATLMGTASLTQLTASYTTSSLALGAHSIRAAYAGDTNFPAANSPEIAQMIADFGVSVPPVGTDPTSTGSTATTTLGGSANFGLTISPGTVATFPADVTFTVTGLPAGATYTLTPSYLPAGSAQTKVVLTIHLPSQLAGLRKPSSLLFGFSPVLAGMLLIPFGGTLRRFGAKRVAVGCVILTLSMTALFSLVGCGASNSGYTNQKTYVVTVTANSGSHSQSSNLTLIVN